MDQQIRQYNRMIQSEQYKKAERYHNGIKYGDYYSLLKRAQSFLLKLAPAFTSLTNMQKEQRYSNDAEFTAEAN